MDSLVFFMAAAGLFILALLARSFATHWKVTAALIPGTDATEIVYTRKNFWGGKIKTIQVREPTSVALMPMTDTRAALYVLTFQTGAETLATFGWKSESYSQTMLEKVRKHIATKSPHLLILQGYERRILKLLVILLYVASAAYVAYGFWLTV